MEQTSRSFNARLVALSLIVALSLPLSQAGAQAALFTSDLTIGSTGAQVTALQSFLISKGYSIPAGATGYFGTQTQAAVAAYQRANGINPPAGYFGPLTRAHVNAVNPGGPNPGTPGTPDRDDELDGGEASLEDFELQDGNDADLEENGTAEVAVMEFDVEDGDVRVNRIDLTFEPSVGNDEDEPWEVFDTIRLLVDGDEIAEENVSDEDDWLRDDEPYVFRFSGIDEIFREGDRAEITIEIEAQNGAVGAGATDSWTIYVDDRGVRAEDAEGLQQYVGDDAETVTFDLDEEGAGEELSIRSSSDDPNAATLQVEDDARSDWYTVFMFELEAEENDIELGDLAIDFETGTADADDVIDDVMLVIDGEEFDDFDWTGSGSFASTTFDIDGDYVVEEGDRVEVEVIARFKAANGTNYAAGETVRASVNGDNVEGEGADDLTADGSATGDTHTLEASGISGSRESRAARSVSVDGADNDYAVFEIEVEISAFEEDAFIPVNAADAFTFQFEDASTGAVLGTATATTSTVTSTADTQGDYYRIDENSSETFVFTATLNPEAANEGRSYRMQLLTVRFNDTPSSPDQTWNALPSNFYETSSTYIND